MSDLLHSDVEFSVVETGYGSLLVGALFERDEEDHHRSCEPFISSLTVPVGEVPMRMSFEAALGADGFHRLEPLVVFTANAAPAGDDGHVLVDIRGEVDVRENGALEANGTIRRSDGRRLSGPVLRRFELGMEARVGDLLRDRPSLFSDLALAVREVQVRGLRRLAEESARRTDEFRARADRLQEELDADAPAGHRALRTSHRV